MVVLFRLDLALRPWKLVEMFCWTLKALFWNLKGCLQTVFYFLVRGGGWKLVKIKCFGIFLEKLYHFKVPKKVKIGEKKPPIL